MRLQSLKIVNLVAFLTLVSSTLFAQSPYQLSLNKESKFYVAGVVSTGLGLYLRNKAPVLNAEEILILNPQDVNAFDRLATDNYSLSAKKASDIFWAGSHLLPLVFLTNQDTRKDIVKIGGLYGEVFFLNAGLTIISKHTFTRTRPFVYNDEVDIDKKFSTNAKTSFFSGHTSFTAANTFFVAKVFSDYHPDSKFKPLVWGLAATIPAATGYFRVAAGKHYPTDVITGYAVGAIIGVLVPHWHRNKNKDRGLSFYGGMNSVLVQYKF